MRNTRNILVVGGDGAIGSALFTALQADTFNVTKTTRRVQNISKETIYLNLANPSGFPSVAENRYDSAILCGAMTSIRDCEENPFESKLINVDGTIKLARSLVQQGTQIIFISTNMVFDGSKPFTKVTDKTCPITEYGRQKVAVEEALQALDANVAIIRFGKIIQPNHALLSHWVSELSAGRSISPYADKRIAPISMKVALKILIASASMRFCGLAQASSSSEISYEECALCIARIINADRRLVRPTRAFHSNKSSNSIYASLDSSSLEKLLCTSPSPLESIIDFAKQFTHSDLI